MFGILFNKLSFPKKNPSRIFFSLMVLKLGSLYGRLVQNYRITDLSMKRAFGLTKLRILFQIIFYTFSLVATKNFNGAHSVDMTENPCFVQNCIYKIAYKYNVQWIIFRV